MAVRNVLLYVCDALRWDAVPRSVAEQGVTIKTVAQSTWSPPCFATLATGLYPEHHGVLTFHHELAEGVRTVCDLDGLDGAYYNKHSDDRLAEIFGVRQDRPLAALDPPFFYIERDLTTHAPYDEVASTDAGSYLREAGSDWERLQRDYSAGVRKSEELFQERLDTLRERGILEDTLVVFTADHGEILGEYGDIGHSNPVCPELTYVPTVLIHPSVSADELAVDPGADVVEQVDVVETALSAIGFDRIPTDGVDLLTERRPDSRGYSYVRVQSDRVTFYEAKSAWDYHGGHVFLTNSRVARLAYFLYRQLRSSHRHAIREDWTSVLGQYVHDAHEFGAPDHSRDDARGFVDAIDRSLDPVELSETTLGEDTEEQLRELGYMT